ncbi:class I SAM-dependent methyltransferase [Rubinisphaera margarita]|uniref:class I SAM-dependent methyltransferase n=1 Tax=Rubinisphaera margarita TaxID=2909586 RepID=UPI001EE84323|nr:class I SAM-dependent methyltransferase [Rubinisphaera margarita]MCG6155274.1 class I SAM-dependent methyltransferase [Rubinisphaera margarita]
MSAPAVKVRERGSEGTHSAATCQVCGSSAVVDIFESRGVPVHVGMFYDSPEAALDAPTGDIVLAHCSNCTFTFNRTFDPAKVFYSPGYEVALHHSPVFRAYIERVVNRLADRYELRNKTILEVGCGDAWFLKQLCQIGGNSGIGVDPTAPYEGKRAYDFGTIELIREYYGAAQSSLEVDFACCLSALEHIAHPREFLQTVRRNLGRSGIVCYFEVFNAYQAFQRQETWSPHYEQCNYFSLESLRAAFLQSGFELRDSGADYQGDQYLYVEASTGVETPDMKSNVDSSESQPQSTIVECTTAHEEKLNHWRQRMGEWRAQNTDVVFWGAAGKGISFLNTLPTKGVVSRVVDINPDKQGKFVPGTGQPIVAPQELVSSPPAVIIISNSLYLEEIRRQVADMQMTCEVLVA